MATHTQSIIRSGMASPVRAMLKTTGSRRSILKRPVALPLSPVYASFSVLAQISSHLKSPHVQFLPSPSLVSTDFEDPRSPRAQPANKQADDKPSFRTRSSSLDLPKRNKKGFTSTVIPAAPTPSFLGRSAFSPAVSSLNRGKKPAPLNLESQLSQDFWQSLSSEEAEKTDDETMVTALEYPVSAVEYEGKLEMDMMSHPSAMFAGVDGVPWSPKPGAVRKDITAPTPHDPFASFPSFTCAAIEMGSITYPPRVALGCGI